MDKKTYAELLKDPRWQKMRLQILERDGWKCQFCGDEKSTLHVHHLAYKNGRKPWEYDSSWLITLCEDCHEKEYDRSSHEHDLIQAMRLGKIPAAALEFFTAPFVGNCSAPYFRLVIDCLTAFLWNCDGHLNEMLKTMSQCIAANPKAFFQAMEAAHKYLSEQESEEAQPNGG